MTVVTRWSLVVLIGACLCSGVTLACPTWPESIGVDFWNYSHYNRQVDEFQRQDEVMGQTQTLVQNRIAKKEAIILDLIESRIQLEDAIQAFWKMNNTAPNLMSVVRHCYPGDSDWEKLGHNVIDHVSARMKHTSYFPNGRIQELEAELELLKCQNQLSLSNVE
ncbi:hypothetical protein [Tuwongella immobilis]|uniref:Uncharacterized protein n=1 Tax=Tuwongella immobilis TaxID=692036 RepID=A0A6C2YR17_9BACT|nr:hypothetical protein [Tuwongella immobilis]VIP03599.1 unnamed protein product [Tuwongella immobilis]VTS04566.1 unnamed protein product [Tuwongella immobilis]